MAGLQMVFEDKVDNDYKIYEVDGYKVAIEKSIIDDYDYIEIKYSNNPILKGFYPCIVDPNNSN